MANKLGALWQLLRPEQRAGIMIAQVEWVLFKAIENGIFVGQGSIDAVARARQVAPLSIYEENTWKADALRARDAIYRDDVVEHIVARVCWDLINEVYMELAGKRNTNQLNLGRIVDLFLTPIKTVFQHQNSPLAKLIEQEAVA